MQGNLFELCRVHTASLAGKIFRFILDAEKKLAADNRAWKWQSLVENLVHQKSSENVNLNSHWELELECLERYQIDTIPWTLNRRCCCARYRWTAGSPKRHARSRKSVLCRGIWLIIVNPQGLIAWFDIWENYCKALPRNRNTMEPLLNSTRREKCPLNKRERCVTELEDAWKKACSCLINNLRQDLHFWFWNV